MSGAEWLTLLQLGLAITVAWLVLVLLHACQWLAPSRPRRYRPTRPAAARPTAPALHAKHTPE
ncbi:MAG: hypothetical protein HC911_14730 [Chloroflexaceae bacterium]|nr:hypothetical protein [Chloroflexaceae bacterium]